MYVCMYVYNPNNMLLVIILLFIFLAFCMTSKLGKRFSVLVEASGMVFNNVLYVTFKMQEIQFYA